jgi:hypothetical protein
MINNRLRTAAIVAVFLLGSISLPTIAQSTTSIDVVPYVKKKVWFHAKGLDEGQKFQVKIQTGSGELLFSETFKNQDQYKKVLDFSFAQEGDYYIDLINDQGLVRKVIHIGEDALVDNSFKFTTEETEVFSRRFMKVDDAKFALTAESTLDSPLSLRIMDENGNILHEEEEIFDNFGKLINLSQLDKGKYSVALSSKNYTTYYSVNLGK